MSRPNSLSLPPTAAEYTRILLVWCDESGGGGGSGPILTEKLSERVRRICMQARADDAVPRTWEGLQKGRGGSLASQKIDELVSTSGDSQR